MANRKNTKIVELIAGVSLLLVDIFILIPNMVIMWQDVSRGYISGSWIIIAKAGSPVWSIVVLIAILVSIIALCILVAGFICIRSFLKNKIGR